MRWGEVFERGWWANVIGFDVRQSVGLKGSSPGNGAVWDTLRYLLSGPADPGAGGVTDERRFRRVLQLGE